MERLHKLSMHVNMKYLLHNVQKLYLRIKFPKLIELINEFTKKIADFPIKRHALIALHIMCCKYIFHEIYFKTEKCQSVLNQYMTDTRFYQFRWRVIYWFSPSHLIFSPALLFNCRNIIAKYLNQYKNQHHELCLTRKRLSEVVSKAIKFMAYWGL